MVGLLLMAAQVEGRWRNRHPDTVVRARALLDDTMIAARLGGYAQGDILRTRIACGRLDAGTLAMLTSATVAAGSGAVRDILESLSPE